MNFHPSSVGHGPPSASHPSPRTRRLKVAAITVLSVACFLCLAAIGLIASDLYFWGSYLESVVAIVGATLAATGAIAAIACQSLSLKTERKKLTIAVLGLSCAISIILLATSIYVVTTGYVGDALDACAQPESYSWDYDYNPGGGEAYCCFGVGVILSWIAWALCVLSVVLVALVVHAERARPGRTQSYNQMPPPQTYQPMHPSHAPPAIGVPI